MANKGRLILIFFSLFLFALVYVICVCDMCLNICIYIYVYTQLRDTPRTRTPSNPLEATVRPFRHPSVLAYVYSHTHPHLFDGIMHGALFSTLHAEGGARLPHGMRGNGTLAAAKMKANGSNGKSVGTLQSNQCHCAHCDNKRSAS